VKHYLRESLLLDAAQCNSYAHRLRNWWTNLAPLSIFIVDSEIHHQRPQPASFSHIGRSKFLPTSYKARETTLVFDEHNRKTKRSLAHLCLLPKSTCLLGRWTRLGVLSCFSHLRWIYRRRPGLIKHEWELIDERCKEFYEADLIQPSSFDFAVITIMSTRKDSARLWIKKRICKDYKPLNLVTPHDRYPMPIPKFFLIALEIQTSSQLWIWSKALTRLCSLRRIARKRHSMVATSCGNGLWCLLDWRMHLFSFNESWTGFSKGHISWNVT